ncbi:hypothetical protein GPLA_4585 [Paraglaciecola polaris LMG 21857]|uniref:Uncharacterized protein n=1 Tax=Paraglaciecola polaris LMG 21857 TaxID=1129793 RepID=K6YRW3_9ALTE|nr:hypothetical protein GPLA_4585 [Paraglaciecola polaris LMG 21857]
MCIAQYAGLEYAAVIGSIKPYSNGFLSAMNRRTLIASINKSK